MKKYYVYGTTVAKMDDLTNVVNTWKNIEAINGYKALGIDNGNEACDIIVEKNGEMSISQDYKKLGWTIDKDYWADIYFMLLSQTQYVTRKKYWYLPLDNYNQPNGLVKEIELTDEEYQVMKNNGQYVYDSYTQALMRAQD